jgi:hypothetical protein
MTDNLSISNKKIMRKDDYIPLNLNARSGMAWNNVKDIVEKTIELRTKKLLERHPSSKNIKFVIGIEQADYTGDGLEYDTIYLSMWYDREETDYEVKDRLNEIKSHKIERYNSYLKMKKEFENINSVEDLYEEK